MLKVNIPSHIVQNRRSYRNDPISFSSTVTEMPSICSTKPSLIHKTLDRNCIKPSPKKSIISWMCTNQNALNKNTPLDESSKIDSFSGNAKEVIIPQHSSNKTSVILIKNNQNKLFKLSFRTINAHFIPLYTKPRIFVDKENDKKIQPYSKSVYIEEYTPHLIRFNTTRKDFKVNHLNDGRNSIMSMKQKVGFLYKKEPQDPKPPSVVSSSKINVQKPILFIKVQNINFKLTPKTLSMDFSKPLVDNLSKSISRDLGFETNEQKKNKGCVIARCGGDILKFTFSMTDINYQKLSELISRGSQISDENIYIRRYSVVTDRIVQVPLPRKIYHYVDPMVEIRRKNEYLKTHKIEPRWMSETRRNRINSNRQCRQVDEAQKAYEATNGSILVFEGPGTLNKAREGLIQCQFNPEDGEKYEHWVVNSQRDTSSYEPEVDYLETYDVNSNREVPDWDLIVYTK